MKFCAIFLFLALFVASSPGQGISGISQGVINGSGRASTLGMPFGQSFVPTSLDPIIGVALAAVDNAGVEDIRISFFIARIPQGHCSWEPAHCLARSQANKSVHIPQVLKNIVRAPFSGFPSIGANPDTTSGRYFIQSQADLLTTQ
jgi:hypothetical protein